jgi:hypothetical protein
MRKVALTTPREAPVAGLVPMRYTGSESDVRGAMPTAANGIKSESMNLHPSYRLSVAPMMDWTDSHCRYFHRLLSRALLYTEMVTSAALVRGGARHLLALRSGGAARGAAAGRVRPGGTGAGRAHGRRARLWRDQPQCRLPVGPGAIGRFGAVLMREPGASAIASPPWPPPCRRRDHVKCRIGVDDQDPRGAAGGLSGNDAGGRRRAGDHPCPQGLAQGAVTKGEPRACRRSTHALVWR